VLFQKLRSVIDPLLSDEQRGFRSSRSCQTALALFTQDVLNGIDKRNGSVGVVFIDFRKAFNSVDTWFLLEKLKSKFGFYENLTKLLNNYLSNRFFQIKYCNAKSEGFLEANSVRQGSSLEPLLFSAFINDIAEVITVPFKLYADDLATYFHSTDTEII